MTNYVRFVPAITTTAVLFSGLVVPMDGVADIPSKPFQTGYEMQKPVNLGSSLTQYKIANENTGTFQKIETIHKFASNLLEHIEDLDPEFSKVIDENYWDLI